MDVIYPRCCGLDIHKKTVVACLMTSEAGQPPVQAIRTFSTMTADLLALVDWLHAAGCTHVAMESTGVYWRPIDNILEGLLTLLVVNAQHMKAVPGRKTDVKDAAWMAELLRHGLLRGSFIPSKPQRQLRELTRHRTTLVQDRARVINRLQMILEDANIKLASVVTDIRGVSARRCWRPSSPENGMLPPSQSWPVDGYAPSGTNWRQPCGATSHPITASW
jgi:transposase